MSTNTVADGFSAFRHRDFRLFWLGQFVSFSGTWMHATAQGWLVYSLTESPLYLGLVSAASTLPIMLLGLFGGALVDRYPKRTLLMLTQTLSVLPALAVGVLTSTGHIRVWHVMVTGLILGTVNAVDFPARQSYLIEMVDRESLVSAIALNSASFNAARLVGPVAAGLVISKLGVSLCFFLNAASFLAVVLALWGISAQGKSLRVGQSKPFLKEVSEGVDFLWQAPLLRRYILMVLAFSLFGIPFISLLPAFAKDVLHVGAQGLGYLTGASGVGALAAALWLARQTRGQVSHVAISTLAVAFCLSLMTFSFSTHYGLSLVAMLVAGGAVVGFLASVNSTLQVCAPDHMRGRIMSIYTLVFVGMGPVGYFLIGLMAQGMGISVAVFVNSALCLVATAVLLRLPEGAREARA